MSRWKMLVPPVVWLVIYVIPPPAGLNMNQWHYFAIFAAVIVGLVLESMPPGAVGFIGLTLAAILGYVESDPAKSLRWALSGFSDATVWLVVGAFVFIYLQNWVMSVVPYWRLIFGAMLAVIVILAPDGLVGLATRRRPALAGRP